MNLFEKRSQNSYNKKAEDYDNTPDGRFTVKFKNALVRLIGSVDDYKVLDVACGNGRLLQQMSTTSHMKGYGVDISERMIDQAKAFNPTMEFHVSSCNMLPFKENFFDILTVCAAFHHFPHVDTFAKEAQRVLRQNGLVYIAEIYLPAFLRAICNPFIRFSRAGDVKFYAPSAIIKLFEANGFRRKNVVIEDNVQIIVMEKL